MTATDLEQSIRGSLQEAGLLQYLDEDKTQFLEFPDGWFAEIVVKDGSKLPEVERVVQRYKEQIQGKESGYLTEIIRPLWTTGEVERIGPSVSFPGLQRAVRFSVVLQSGRLSCTVTVDVTEGALALIREKLRDTEAPEDMALTELVHEFMKMQLFLGGESYWDPRRDPRLELDAAAFMYLMGNRDPVRRLQGAINSVFGCLSQDEIWDELKGKRDKRLDRVRSFFSTLQGRGVAIEELDNALPFLGRGEEGPGSESDSPNPVNRELYSMLLEFEKGDLRKFYLEQVDKNLKDFPQLKSEFPGLFPN
jgi:hypothetical protein